MRYAYVKTNNVVHEVKRVLEREGTLAEGGPDAYVAHFLDIVGGSPALLISTHFFPSEIDECFVKDNIVARSIYWYSRRLKRFGNIAKHPLGTVLTRVIGSGKIFLYLVRFRPDRVLCWAFSLPLWATYAAAVARGATFIYCSHGHLISERKTWYQRLTGGVDRWIMRRASAVIVHGPYLKQQMIDIGIDSTKILEFNWSFRDFVDRQRNEVDHEISGIDGTQSAVVLFIGRMDKSKGIFELLEALTDRLRREATLELIYAGDGNDLEGLRHAVIERGLHGKVRMLGRVAHDLLPALIKRSRFVVTPTQGWYPEGRCMAALEGLVMGRPVIAPDFGPFRFVVHHGINGLLFEPDSVKDLRKKIFELLDDEELYRRVSKGAVQSSYSIVSAHINFGRVVRTAFGCRESFREDRVCEDRSEQARLDNRIESNIEE